MATRTKRKPNQKTLREDLADKKSALEADGWEFTFNEDETWEAKTSIDGTVIGTFPKLEELLAHLEGMRKIQEKYAPETLNGNSKPETQVFDIGDIPAALHRERNELEANGWRFERRLDLKWDISFEGVNFHAYESLAAAVESARSLSGCSPQKLKEIAFEADVEKLLRLRFKNREAGSDNEVLYQMYADAVVNSDPEVAARSEAIFDKFDALIENGWKFSLDEDKRQWSAGKEINEVTRGGEGFNSLERLIGVCEKYERESGLAQDDESLLESYTRRGWDIVKMPSDGCFGAKAFGDFSESVSGISDTIEFMKAMDEIDARYESAETSDGENLPTEEQAEKMGELIENGWAFAQSKENRWSAEREIDGKKVYCGEHFYLDALFAQMEGFDKPAEVNEFKLPLTSIETCLVELGDEDILSRSYSLTKALKDLESEAIKFKIESENLKSEHKKAAAAIEARVNKYRTAIDNRSEYREIRCEIEYDFERSQVKIVRPDTNKVVKTRAMTKDEALASGTLV